MRRILSLEGVLRGPREDPSERPSEVGVP
jgi:hypothetical protein